MKPSDPSIFDIWLRSGAGDAWRAAMAASGAPTAEADAADRFLDPTWYFEAGAKPGGDAASGAFAERQALALAALGAAFQRFTAAMAADPAQGPDAVSLWIKLAGEELAKMMAGAPFQAVERRALKSGIDFRQAQRAAGEAWARSLDLPSRAEVDDLHQTVHALQREIRALKAARDEA